jgi:hypothetical protein
MLDLNCLLERADIDPAAALVVRHAPVEKALKRVLPWLVAERPDLWLAYQRIQWASLEKAMTRAKYIASFVGEEPATATFAGLYRIGNWHELNYAGYNAFPGKAELAALGMAGRSPDMGNCLAFDLKPLPAYADWSGRLIVAWPQPHLNWWRWADRARFDVTVIERESRFVPAMPDWQDIVLTHAELQSLPAAWRSALAQWRGVYFIYDTRQGAGYVGSAYGADNIFGRWQNYARTGHGGNIKLRRADPANLRFSILQRTSPDLEPTEVVRLEASWKERLHTRALGLNAN